MRLPLSWVDEHLSTLALQVTADARAHARRGQLVATRRAGLSMRCTGAARLLVQAGDAQFETGSFGAAVERYNEAEQAGCDVINAAQPPRAPACTRSLLHGRWGR